MNVKSIIPLFLIILMIFSTAESVFGAADATISVEFDKENVQVGDTVNIIVTIKNTGDQDLNNINVSAKLPDGLKFLMSATGTSKNLYTPSTGLWQVDNLRLTSKNSGVKTLSITAEVLPSLKGEKISTSARFTSVSYGDPPVSIMDQVNSANSNVLTIKGDENVANNTNGTAINGGSNTNKKTTLKQLIKNATKSKGGISAVQNLNQPASKAYEISNATSPGTSDNSKTLYAVIGGLIIAILIGIGYFRGIKN